MSENSPSKTPAAIKIAAKDASQRGASGTKADPGPGDPNAMPSEMPEPVSIPAPPSPSELVIKSAKSGNSRVIKTINDPVSLSKSRGSSASTALKSVKTQKTLSGGASRNVGLDEDGQSRSKSHPSAKSVHGSKSGGGSAQSGPAGSEAPAVDGSQEAPEDHMSQPSGGSRGGLNSGKSKGSSAPPGGSASKDMQADSGSGAQEHDLIEDGETEIEHPSGTPSPSPSGGSGTEGSRASTSPASGGIDSAPASSGGGTSKLSSKTSGHRSKPSDTSSVGSSASRKHHHHHGKKHGKKTSKFRYHKRVTVRTHGKTSPSEVMDKVTEKDHKAGITPSSIGEMDTEELMKRAGIKGGKKAHWRVRLRQTKRIIKDGKTVTQTQVAYRDSEGNKRIKTSATPDCKKCGKKLEDCQCDD